MRINKSIYFKDANSKEYFLFQLLNYGKTEELKFIFNAKNQGTGIVHSPDSSFISRQDTIKPYAEVSYHSDGYMHYKLPKYMEDDKNDYRSRFKGTPLNQITDWEPILKYIVVDYSLCKKKESSGVMSLLENNEIFNGDPFECVFCLIHMRYMTPSTDEPNDMVFRINDIAKDIDLLLFIRKSSYGGKLITIPNTNITVFNKGNVLQIVEKKK